VYSLQGQRNSIRLGEPIECAYGKNRIFPSYASRPYFEYRDNDQYLFSLFCVGQGSYEIHSVSIGETALSEFEEVQYEIIPPGGTVTLFPTSVYTSSEAGGQKIPAPNEDDYPDPDGWVGPFVCNPAGTQATELQIDLVYPKGIYHMNDEGNLENRTITVEVGVREIDDEGNPIGSWSPIFSVDGQLTITAKTTTPQRRSHRQSSVAPGRYEIRMRRTDNFDNNYRTGHEVQWGGMRAYLSVDIDYGNVTLLAVMARATNNLNSQTQQLVNVLATRKLSTRDIAGNWSEPVATQSIVWALVDILRSVYGGRLDDDSFFDWPTLQALESHYASRGDTFDWIFRDPSTVWEACQMAMRVGRAVPLLKGSLVTVKKDVWDEVPVAIFTPDNILKGSFEWQIRLWEAGDHDGLRVEYTDPDKGYRQEAVVASLPEESGADRPMDVRLCGCSNRIKAYREGMYMLAADRYLRENVVFETGLEGLIPSYGDVIGIAHDVPQWGQAGYVVHAEYCYSSYYQLWLSEPVRFEESGTHQIYLRSSTGGVLGPFTALETASTRQILLNWTESEAPDFLLGGSTEPVLFVFGAVGQEVRYWKVLKVEPQGGEKIRITAVNLDSRIYSYDTESPPSAVSIDGPSAVPEYPKVDRLVLSRLASSTPMIQAHWSATYGVSSYIVQISQDGSCWSDLLTTSSTGLVLEAAPGTNYVRVAAVGGLQGAWTQASLDLSTLAGLDVSIPWNGLGWGVQWWPYPSALGYRVRVWDLTIESTPVLKRTEDVTSTSYFYSYSKALADENVVGSMRVAVDVRVLDEESGEMRETGYPVALDLVEITEAPTDLAYTQTGVESDGVLYLLSWIVPEEEDLIRLRLWISPDPNFSLATTAPYLDTTLSSPGYAELPSTIDIKIPYDSNGGHEAYYWQVAVNGVWDQTALSLNVSSRATIPAREA
jgi:hypothetical protein